MKQEKELKIKPRQIKAVLMHGDLLGAERADGRWRPIAVPGFVRKMAMSAVQQVFLAEAKAATGNLQFGLATKDGTTLMFSVLE